MKISVCLKKFIKSNAALMLSLAAAAFILFFNALFFDYTWLDDIYLIFSRNSELQHFGLADLLKQDFFLTGQSSSSLFYRPMALLPWIIAAKIAGTSLWMYHLENLLFHIFAGCSFFALMMKLGISRKSSLLAAAVFLLSPAGAAIAGFTPNLSYPMMMFFVNLSFISGIDFLANKKIPFFISHLFFFMLAMFTLETALGFIPVFMFYAFFVFRKECKTISRESLRMASSVSVAYAAVFILWFIVRRSAIGGGMPERDISVIINNIPAFFSSLVNFFIPFAARPLAKASYSIMPLLPGIAIVFVLAYLPFAGLVRNLRLYIIGLLFYLFFLMPSFMSGFEFNDMPHRIYVPSAGLLIMLSQVCWRRILPKKAIPAFCAAAVVFVSCCGVFFLRNYSNADIFWNRVLKDNPGNAAAYKQIININYEQGNYGQAAKTAYDFLEASGGDPDARVLYASNCGLADMPETAEENFRILLRDYPDRSDYRTAYAEFLALSGHDGAAENEHKKSLEYAPEYVYGHFSYANYLFSAGNLQGAENEYRNALRMSSKTSGRDWLNTFKYAKECSENLSYLLISKAAAEKDAKTAANILKEAAELNPSAMVYEKSADIMLANHLYREAASLYALAADSGEGNASRSAVGAGVAHVHSGDLKKAAYYFNLALEIDPGNRQAQLYRDELAVRIFNQPDK